LSLSHTTTASSCVQNKQEGWLSPTERPSVSAITNQPKTQFGYRRRVTPVCRCLHPFCGWRHWLHQESLRHILAVPGYAPGTIAVNVAWMERGFNAGQKRSSIYPSIFNRLRAIARYWTSLAFNAPIGGVPIGIPGKCLVLRKLESWHYQAVKTV